MKVYTITALAFGILLASNASYGADEVPTLQKFEFLGCSGDITRLESEPDVWRLTTGEGVSFLVHHSAGCGLSGRNPVVQLIDGELDLGYELYSQNRAVDMCLCEYWVRFSFGPSEYERTSVLFEGNPVRRKGTWPK